MKKFLSLVVSAVMMFSLVVMPLHAEETSDVIEVSTAEELVSAMNTATTTSYTKLTISITDDIDLSGITWVPGKIDANKGAQICVVEGNNKTITGLTRPLFSGTWAGKTGLTIKNLTISNSEIVEELDDATEKVPVGAFIGGPSASTNGIVLENCHVLNSYVKGGHWTGGLIGTADGYSGSDGPVFMTVEIKNCSVKDSLIEGKGSIGGIIGHAARDAWTEIIIEDCVVEGNEITSTGDSTIKAGSIVGTVGAAGSPVTSNGVTLTGGVYVNATVTGNTVTSNNEKVDRIFGRFGSSNGVLTLTGGTYDHLRENSVKPTENITGTKLIIKENVVFRNDPKAIVVGAYLSESSQRIVVDMEKTRIAESIVLELYSGDTLITKSTGSQKVVGYSGALTGGILFGDETSSWWNTDEWVLNEDLKPTTVKVYIDGEFVAETSVYKTQNTNDKKGEELTEDYWVDLEITVHVHQMKEIKGTEATCTSTGKLVSYKCESCGKVYLDEEGKVEVTDEKQLIAPALGHKETKIPAVAATCEKTGLTEGTKCSVCNEILKAQEVEKALGHKEVVEGAKEATCKEEGHTGNKVCEVCDKVLEEGKAIAKKAHTYKDGKCTVCGAEDPDYVQTTTGDHAPVMMYAGIAMLSMAAMVVLKKKELF